jgi:hypothetical protein
MSDAAPERPEFIWEGDREYRVDPSFWSLSPEAQAKARADLAARGPLDYPTGVVSGPSADWKPPPSGSEYEANVVYGATEPLATMAGLPMEISKLIGENRRQSINRVAQQFGFSEPPSNLSDLGLPSQKELIPEVSRTYGGIEDMKAARDALLGPISQKPRDPAGKTLAATGGAVTDAAVTMAGGKGLQALAPAFGSGIVGRFTQKAGDFLAAGADTLKGRLSNLAINAAGGAGAEEAGQKVAESTDNPWLKAGAELGGGLLAGGALSVGSAAAINAAKFGREAARLLTKEGNLDLAGRVLNQSRTNPLSAASQGPYPSGISPTIGQAENDPGLLLFEKSLANKPQLPDQAAAAMAQRTAANRQVLERLGTVGDTDLTQQESSLSRRIWAGINAKRRTARADESQSWKAIDPDKTSVIPTAPLKQQFRDVYNNLEIAYRDLIPKDYIDKLNSLPATVPMREVMALRSTLRTHARMAAREGNNNAQRVLGDVDDALFKPLTTEGRPWVNADEAATLRYQDAVKKSAAYHQTFNDGEIGDAWRLNRRGGRVVQQSDFADHMFGPGAGQAERAEQFVAAAQGDERTLQLARDWVASRMRQRASGAAQEVRTEAGGEPNQMLLGNQLRRFINENEGLLNSSLFTPEQRQVFNEARDAIQMIERTARAGTPNTSDTARMLFGGNYLKELIGGWYWPVLKMVGTGAAALGTHTLHTMQTGEPYGGLVTGGVVALGANRLVEKAVSDASNKVLTMVGEASRNPALARELMERSGAQDGGPQFVTPQIRNFLSTLPITAYSADQQNARQIPAYDAAVEAVSRMGPGENVTIPFLRDATGLGSVTRLQELQKELTRKGVINNEKGYYRRSEPSSPNSGGPRSEAIEPHPLRDTAYKAAQQFTPTLRRSTFDEIAQAIEERTSPLYGQLVPGGLYEQLAEGRATHETIKLAKLARVFQPNESRILTSKAENWADKFGIPGDLPAPVRRDEAIATAYNLWNSGDMQLPPGLRRIFGSYRTFTNGLQPTEEVA